jgi:hypothetical protein
MGVTQVGKCEHASYKITCGRTKKELGGQEQVGDSPAPQKKPFKNILEKNDIYVSSTQNRRIPIALGVHTSFFFFFFCAGMEPRAS